MSFVPAPTAQFLLNGKHPHLLVPQAVQALVVHPAPVHAVADEHVVIEPAFGGLQYEFKLQPVPLLAPSAQYFPL